tara:strand:- start:3015 stop:3632 length:618 start_codon:yes stop_codon:yes gene_type:complete
MEVSSVAPLQNLSPLFLLVIGFTFLGERLTLLQILGILILVFGAYFIEIKHHSKNLLEPFKEIIKSKYTIFVILALVIYAVSAALEKYILSNGVNTYSLLIIYRLISAVIFITITFVFYKGFTDIVHGIKETGVTMAFIALVGIGSTYFYYEALSLAYVSLVIPIKRLSTLMTTMVGGEMFHEHNLTHKAIGCLIMIAGAVCIAI